MLINVGDNMNLKSTLFGLLVTDGCIHDRFVIFHNKSEILTEIFKKCMQEIFGDIHFTERLEQNGTKRTQISSKLIAKSLLKTFGLKTMKRKREEDAYPKVKIPYFIKNLSRKELCEFFKTVFSADGSISVSVRWHNNNKNLEIRRRVELSCEHPKLRDDYFILLQKLGFNPRINGINITLEKKSDIVKFEKEIGFIPGVKISRDSKFWYGFEKNKVLDTAVKSLDIDSKQFKNKESLLGYLKSI